MGMTHLKVLFAVSLIFTVVMATCNHFQDLPNCWDISQCLLFTSVVPIKYDLSIVVKPKLTIVSGTVNITVDVKKPTKIIILHARGLLVNSNRTKIMTLDTILKDNQEDYRLLGIQYCDNIEIIILIFNNVMSRGQYLLHIEYSTILDENTKRIFYPSTWVGKVEKWMFTNLYTPNSVRSVFPCWDNPTIKASCNILVRHSPNDTVFSNMPIQNTSLDEYDFKMTYFQETPPIPTYLIAIMMIEDIKMDLEQNDINIMWHKQNANKLFEYALEKIEIIRLFFTTHIKINIARIFPKIDHIVLPDSPLKSMSAPGLIVYREKDISYDKDSNDTNRSIDIVTLIAYEMSRQFFVGLVSPHLNTTDIWLNEILASFFSYYIVDGIWESGRLMELFVVKNILFALDSNIYLDKESIKNNEGIDALLYPLFYHKKAFALIRMLYQIFTPEIFDEAIKRYVQMRTTDVWTIMEEVYPLKEKTGYTVKEIMESWFTAKRHPEIKVELDFDARKAYCIPSYIQPNIKWMIPIHYVTQENINLKHNNSNIIWLQWDQVLAINDINPEELIIINTGQLGYYRVNYDNKNWESISAYLNNSNKYKSIPILSRAQIINDAYYFTKKGELNISVFLDIISYLKNEMNYIAWYPMFNIFYYMSKFLNSSKSEHVKLYFVQILNALLLNVGYEERLNDDSMMTSLRSLGIKWACKMKSSACWTAATNKLIEYINNTELNVHRIPSTWENWILCSGMSRANLTTWQFIFREGINNNNTKLLENLACSEDVEIIIYYLQLITRTNHGKRIEGGKVCRSIIKRHANKYAVLDYVLRNHILIKDRFSNDFPGDDLFNIAIMNVYSMHDLNKIYEVIEKDINSTDHKMFTKLASLIDKRKKQINNERNAFKMFW